MTSRFAGIMAVIALAVGLAVPAARAQTQTHIERIQLQHIDARIVAALLGAPVLPNEVELLQQRSFGGGVAPGFGYGNGGGYGYGASPYGGYGYGAQPFAGSLTSNRLVTPYAANGFTPGYAQAYGQAGNNRAPWFAQGGAPSYSTQPGFVVDPNTNAAITGR